MKKLLLLLLCAPLMFSCGEQNDINELKGNNNKYDFHSFNGDGDSEYYGGYVFNKETGELWLVSRGWANHTTNFTKLISKEDLK